MHRIHEETIFITGVHEEAICMYRGTSRIYIYMHVYIKKLYLFTGAQQETIFMYRPTFRSYIFM